MSGTKNDKPAVTTAYDHTKKLIATLAEDGMLAPLMGMLDIMVENPLLRKTLEDAPAPFQPRKLN